MGFCLIIVIAYLPNLSFSLGVSQFSCSDWFQCEKLIFFGDLCWSLLCYVFCEVEEKNGSYTL